MLVCSVYEIWRNILLSQNWLSVTNLSPFSGETYMKFAMHIGVNINLAL